MDISSRPTYVEDSAETALKSLESFVDRCLDQTAHLPLHLRLVEPIITPRFVPSCSDDLLSGIGKISAEKSLRIQSHLAEAHDQVEWVKRQRGMDDLQVFTKASEACRQSSSF